MVWPWPWQSGQGELTLKKPWLRTTWPVPRQVEQVLGEWPGLQPEPLQVVQGACLVMSISS